MGKYTTKKLVLDGLMIALVFLATYFTYIPGPIPPGYINFGDSVIMTAAVLLGRRTGFLAGAIGSCLADLALGAFIYAPITFIVKGLEGYAVGLIAFKALSQKTGELHRIVAIVAGAVLMVAGYFGAEAVLLSFFDQSFGFAAAVANLPLNLVQGGVSIVAGYLISAILSKANIQKILT